MKLYDDPVSGNGYKARLLLSHLGHDYEYVPLDGARRYRVRGRRGSELYLAFCVYDRTPDGATAIVPLW